jgi:hypothetical protein
MIDEVVVFAQVAVIIVFLLGSLATIGVLTFRALQRSGKPAPLRDGDERMAQLQQSIDAIAIEVERIAEGQRYTTRLLAERSDAVR